VTKAGENQDVDNAGCAERDAQSNFSCGEKDGTSSLKQQLRPICLRRESS